jgi:hypothetical protein
MVRGCCAINRIAVKGVRKATFKECRIRLRTLKGRAWRYKFGRRRGRSNVTRAIGVLS